MRCDRTFAVLAKVPLYRVRLSGWALELDIKNAKMYTSLPNKIKNAAGSFFEPAVLFEKVERFTFRCRSISDYSFSSCGLPAWSGFPGSPA
ncbi:hypothetical protein [Alteribacillus sp. YIM 98480]|uniref:hypothetical protein n=1 Tax=Alteribacillus sp. YIM 98480 TaxID=2606599 RepID=UPI001E5DE72B|nr:hypothetical protein [Alteribacillus sp. YIM 98480]